MINARELSDTTALSISAGKPKRVEIPDAETDYWLTKYPRPGINYETTQDIATIHGDRLDAARGIATAIAAGMGGLSILLAGMVIGHLFLLPDATIWPLACAALLSGVGAIAVLSGVLRH